MKIPKRCELESSVCWKTADLFADDQTWERELDACSELPGRIASYQGRLSESAHTLLEFLQLTEKENQRVEKLYVYAMLKSDEDTANSLYQGMKGRCFSFLVQLESAGAFEGPELIAIDDEALDRFYNEEPGLEKYRRYLEKIRVQKAHTLSQKEENLLAAVGEIGSAPGRIFNTFHDADMKFPAVTDSLEVEHAVTNGSYISLMESSDRVLRENAFRSYYGVFSANRNTLAAMLDAEVRKDVFYARTRNYGNSLESALKPVEISEEVYHNLIKAVRQNLAQMHRYMALRKKVMGVDELHMYDIYAGMLPEANQVIDFQQAKEDVLEATRVLGEEYYSVLKKSFDEGWIDIYENKGKRSGAYSCGSPIHPFVLLNHKDNLNSVFTLAHEMGHAMHSYLSNENQPPVYADYVLFVAEVASTCNEALLMQHLLKKTPDKKQRAVLINYFLEQFRTTLYRQTMFAEFELKIHQLVESGETLTAEILCQVYYDLNRDYYGADMVIDKEIEMEWSRIPHFYRRFYVYQYATGFSAAMALSKRILDSGEKAVKDYLAFLSGGCSTDPVSLLKIAGVDMSTPQPVNDALELFAHLIDELEELLV